MRHFKDCCWLHDYNAWWSYIDIWLAHNTVDNTWINIITLWHTTRWFTPLSSSRTSYIFGYIVVFQDSVQVPFLDYIQVVTWCTWHADLVFIKCSIVFRRIIHAFVKLQLLVWVSTICNNIVEFKYQTLFLNILFKSFLYSSLKNTYNLYEFSENKCTE